MNTERKLAHIEIIESLTPIEGADKIEVAQILGWQCVVKKGEFEAGQKIVYIEVDSIVPEKPEFEFLRDRKFRVKTIKLRGQISQGLVIPVNSLPIPKKISAGFLNIGDDVTKYLGIKKYLSPTEQNELYRQEEKIKLEKNRLKKFMMRYSWFRKIFLSENKISGFPYWVSKTDEERIQNIPQVLEQFKDNIVYVTEKIDYQSGTWTSKKVPKFGGILSNLPFYKTIFVVASRNLQINNKNSLYWQIAKKYNLENICKKYPGIIIQGEQGNSKIQGNKYDLTEPKMWVFNIILPNGKFLNPIEIDEFCQKHSLDSVPLLEKVPLSRLGNDIEDVVKYSQGKSKINNKIQREGIVVRSIENGQKLLSFKVINPKFLLKYE